MLADSICSFGGTYFSSENTTLIFLPILNFSEVYRDYCQPFLNLFYQQVFVGHLKSSDNYSMNLSCKQCLI